LSYRLSNSFTRKVKFHDDPQDLRGSEYYFCAIFNLTILLHVLEEPKGHKMGTGICLFITEKMGFGILRLESQTNKWKLDQDLGKNYAGWEMGFQHN